MRRSMTFLFTVACLAALLLGCTSAREAVEPSVLLLVDNIEQYDQALRSYAKAENDYYRGLKRVLTELAGRAASVDQGNLRVAAIDQYVDGLLLEQNAVSVTDMKQFLRDTDQELNALVAARRVAEVEATAASEAAFERLRDARKELQKIKGELLQIVREPTVTEQIRWWIEYADTVKSEYDELTKAEEQADGE